MGFKKLTMTRIAIIFVFTFASLISWSQYSFVNEQKIECTSVKNQARTGTCWSFATASFLESEIIKKKDLQIDLSEMFVVRNNYEEKAQNYVLRQGKANFSQGSLSHDLIRNLAKNGAVPDEVYSGLRNDETRHNHSEMEAGLKGFLDGIIKSKRLSLKWKEAFNSILDVYLGQEPKNFVYKGKNHTPKSFAEWLDIKPSDYISLSSFTHHPFYEKFILEIPDNYSNGTFYNVPIDELVEAVDYALAKGYTIAWDGDVSEKGFSAKEGIAILPTDEKREDLFTNPGKEVSVNQDLRQSNFESYATTDDHLMHLVGTAEDQKGNKYYLIKNSWGEISDYKGYIYMSEAYLKMKTVAIMLNKNALTDQTSKKIFTTR